MLLIHSGDDGIGAAHRLVADPDGLGGLDIRQTVVVDDLQNLRLMPEPCTACARSLWSTAHTLAPGAQQVIPGQGTDDLLVLVQHRVAAVAALQHHFPHIVDVVRQMEADDVVSVAGAGDGDGLIDETGHPAGIVWGWK
mgnify:CR=1 FL=1